MVVRIASILVLVLALLASETSLGQDQTPTVEARLVAEPSSVTLGEPFILRLAVRTQTFFTTGIRLDDPLVPLGIVRRIGRSVSYTENVDGQAWAVSERRYLVWTSAVGNVTVESQTIRTESPPVGGFRGVPVEVETPAISVRVEPPIDGADPTTWIAAENLTATASWSRNLDGIRVGDAVTLTIDQEAVGTVSALLKEPVIPIPVSDSWSIHHERPLLTDEMGAATNTARRTDRWTIIFEAPGTLTAPGIEIPWWDFRSRSLESVVIAGAEFAIEPNPDLEAELVGSPDTAGVFDGDEVAGSWWPPSARELLILVICMGAILLLFKSTQRYSSDQTRPGRRERLRRSLPPLNPGGRG